MIHEAINRLAELVTTGQEPRLVRVSEYQALLFRGDAEPVEIALEPPPEAHKLFTLASFLEAVQNSGYEDCLIFVNSTQIICVSGPDERKHSISFGLPIAPQFATVKGLRREQPFPQRELHELLRHDLRGFEPEGLKQVVKQIKARSSQSATSEITQGRERGTMEFQSEVTAEISIPETVAFHVPVFRGEGIDFRRSIECSLDVTLPPAPVSFRIEPLPGEVDRVVAEVLQEILGAITGEVGDTPVLIGDTDLWRPGRNGFVPQV